MGGWIDGRKTYVSDDAARALLVSTQFPPHSPAEPVLLDVMHLAQSHFDRVVAYQRLTVGVVRVACAGFLVDVLGRARAGEDLVVPYPVLPGPLAHAVEGLADACRVAERPPVQRHAQHQLRGRDPAARVVLDHRLDVVGRAAGALCRRVQVRLVSRCFVPGS